MMRNFSSGAISPHFYNIFDIPLSSGVKLHIHLLNIVVRFIVFLNSAKLICRDTNISKYFSESFGLRDNASRLFVFGSCHQPLNWVIGADVLCDYEYHFWVSVYSLSLATKVYPVIVHQIQSYGDWIRLIFPPFPLWEKTCDFPFAFLYTPFCKGSSLKGKKCIYGEHFFFLFRVDL